MLKIPHLVYKTNPLVGARIEAGQSMEFDILCIDSDSYMRKISPKPQRLNKFTSCSHCMYKIGQKENAYCSCSGIWTDGVSSHQTLPLDAFPVSL